MLRATWSIKELVRAAHCLPGIVVWSGIVASHVSSPALKVSTGIAFMSLRSLGIRLNSLAPFTCSDISLAFFTSDADVVASFVILWQEMELHQHLLFDNQLWHCTYKDSIFRPRRHLDRLYIVDQLNHGQILFLTSVWWFRAMVFVQWAILFVLLPLSFLTNNSSLQLLQFSVNPLGINYATFSQSF